MDQVSTIQLSVCSIYIFFRIYTTN